LDKEVNAYKELAGKGRKGDTQLAHVTPGEMVVNPEDFSPEFRAELEAQMRAAGVDPERYTVGEGMSINPETGLPEFGFKFKKVFKRIAKLAPLAAAFIPGLSPLAAAGIGAASGLATGGGLRGALLGGIGGYIGKGGLGDTMLGRGLSSIKSGASGALSNFGNYTGLSDAFSSASGALDGLYKNSLAESAINSGGDALRSGAEGLKSLGINTSSTSPTAQPSVGGGASAYGPSNYNSRINEYGPQLPTEGATQVAQKDYASPLLSALLGSRTNNQAEKALLAGQNANRELLAPYANGFNFAPGDLTQDPGYQFNLQQGTQAADRAQLARGGYFSGGAAKELAEFNQGLADNTYNSAYNRALQGRQAGLQGAQVMAGVNDNFGNIKAKTIRDTGNVYSGALGSFLGGDSFTNTGALRGGQQMPDWLRELVQQGR